MEKRRDSTSTSALKSGAAVCDSSFKHQQQLLLPLKTSISFHISLVERQQAQRDGQLLQAGNSFKSYRKSSGNLCLLPLTVKNVACICCQMLHCQLPLPQLEIGCCSGIARYVSIATPSLDVTALYPKCQIKRISTTRQAYLLY